MSISPESDALPSLHAPLRLLHAALLLRGGPALAREFWQGHPLEEDGRSLAGADLVRHIWRENGRSPLPYVLRVLSSVESFCLRYGVDFEAFVRDEIFALGSGTMLGPRECLSLVGEFLPQVLGSADVRLSLLRALETVNDRLVPGSRLRLVCHQRQGDRVEAWIEHGFASQPAWRLRDFDAQIWCAGQIRDAPRRLESEPFREVECWSLAQPVGDIFDPVLRGPAPLPGVRGWSLEGRPLTQRLPMRDWLAGQGLDPEGVSVAPEREVDLLLQDWICPLRGRRLLRKGMICGADVYLYRARWSLNDEPPPLAGVQRLVRIALGEEPEPVWIRINRLHEEYLEQESRSVRFVYHRQDETISCNGEHLLKGVPAKILQKVLMAHTITGRSLFEHREFRRDPDLKLDPVNPNLESRLRILEERLRTRVEGVRLAKSQKGRFQLEADFPITYEEESC